MLGRLGHLPAPQRDALAIAFGLSSTCSSGWLDDSAALSTGAGTPPGRGRADSRERRSSQRGGLLSGERRAIAFEGC